MNKLFTFMRESSTARFFIPLGLILIIFGTIMFIINTKNQNYIKTEAIVSNVKMIHDSYTDTDGNQVDASYSITIKYIVDGKEYESIIDDMPKYDVNEKTTIYYNPNNPSEFTQTKSLIIPIIIIVSGVISLTGGIVSIVNVFKNHKKMKEQERSWENAK